jgi:hypothetical protein
MIIAFKRKDDGELFTLNKDKTTYSLKFMKKEFPNHLHMKYEKKHLQSDKFLPIYKNKRRK